ncbi:hypothetical protein C8Q80DRAFT_838958 [Daedaleopsis nitida]|nr:hypothetical protein C8Q80DRAFT_838958 [Daedaleopsis nitida]
MHTTTMRVYLLRCGCASSTSSLAPVVPSNLLQIGMRQLWALESDRAASRPVVDTWLQGSRVTTPSSSEKGIPRFPNELKSNLRTAALLASLYWITQESAWLYPGTTGVSPLPGRSTSSRGH